MVTLKNKAKVKPSAILLNKPKRTHWILEFPIIFLALIFSSTLLYSQHSDSLAYNDNKSVSLKYLKSIATMEQEKCDNARFLDKYEVDLSMCKEATVGSEIHFNTEPSKESPKCKMAIPEGSVVKLYKYFEGEKYWAAKFKNKWGFLPESSVKFFE